jgi:hypothetical protein
MNLYHFTKAVNLPGIMAHGLIPNVPALPFFTLGKPVVWLTTMNTMKTSDLDMAWLEGQRGTTFSDAEVEQFSKRWLGGPKDRRLTVSLNPISTRLTHWTTWLRKHPAVFVDDLGRGHANDNGELWGTKALLAMVYPSARLTWYVYFGTIPTSRIIEGLSTGDEDFGQAEIAKVSAA